MNRKDSSLAAFTWVELLVVIAILASLVAISVPLFQAVQDEGVQARCMGHAQGIGLALKLFAGDHNGVYPKAGTPAQLTGVAGSNDAFASLFPAYCRDETLFANKRSAYNYKTPDNHIDPSYTGARALTLANGENAYAYMMNLTDSGDPAWPLVMDAPSSRDNPTYPPGGRTVRGSVWDGTRAIIIYLDCSGTLSPVDQTSFIVKRRWWNSVPEHRDAGGDANILIPVAAQGNDPGWAAGGVLELPQ